MMLTMDDYNNYGGDNRERGFIFNFEDDFNSIDINNIKHKNVVVNLDTNYIIIKRGCSYIDNGANKDE